MRIIGIDPGMAIVGYSIIDANIIDDEEHYSVVESGSIQTDKSMDKPSRLLEIAQDLNYLINLYKPDVASVEELFFFKNAKTIVPVCEARGVILLTLKQFRIPINEYTPLAIKQTVTGYGRANKTDVQEMIKLIIRSDQIPKLDDSSDAMAIAICHVRNSFASDVLSNMSV